MTQGSIPRRRFIAIAAAASGMPLLAARHPASALTPSLRIWSGVALGADATLQINHPDATEADRLIEQSLAEVERLEAIFSLYRPASALARLNRDGVLDDPPPDLLRLLSESQRFSDLTGGAFDVTVQPLWDVYAAHFARAGADPSGPPQAAIAAALRRIGHQRIVLDPARIAFAEPAMAVTLNGIAQGYVTDRVVALLRRAGIAHALVDMGETCAIGSHPDGAPWSVGIEDPFSPGSAAERISLRNHAVATSGGYGTRFDATGRFNHIFDPASGATSWRYKAVSVIARDATTADALSTAMTLLPLAQCEALVQRLGLAAHFVTADGRRLVQTA
ncbi:MAG: FAD:protein FMN transferase [Acetobacteraceae bacterium]